LVAVANAGEEKAGGEGGWKVKTARVGLIRDGERMSVEVTPEARPAEMLVTGVGVRGSATQPDMIVLPNGGTLQVGPGYVVDLNAEAGGSGGLSVSSIRQVLSKGQTIVLSQESDGFGNVRNSVTVGGKTYDADPAGLAAMPAEVRELVDPLLKQAPRVVKIGPRTATELNLEQQVKEQERKIEELTRKLEAIQGKLDEKK